MARTLWTGSLSFGLVSIPVGLYPATQDKSVHFNEFQKGTSSRIAHKRVNRDSGDEVDYSDIVKGYDSGDGRFVLLSAEELEAVEPGRSRNIEVTDFVQQSEIDPIFYRTTYYLGAREEAGSKPYSLLHQAMRRSDKVGIATIVMRSKQYLATVRADKEILVLETMYFADEVRAPAESIGSSSDQHEFAGRELDTAVALIDSLTTDWDPYRYRDDYRHRVLDLIASKNDGLALPTPPTPDNRDSNVLDLMAALERSLEASQDRRSIQSPGSSHPGRSGSAQRPGVRGSEESDPPPAFDPSSLSKADLYERAKDLGIQGRSKMARPELIEAIRSALSTSGALRAS
ncbi:MAG: Ku protein [Acidimicrobiales bacterium]